MITRIATTHVVREMELIWNSIVYCKQLNDALCKFCFHTLYHFYKIHGNVLTYLKCIGLIAMPEAMARIPST